MFYLHAEKGKDEYEEEEEEKQGEDGGDGVRQSQHQVSQARPVPDIMMCHSLFQMSKQVNAGNFCQLYNHTITNRWDSLGHFENPQKPESTKGRDAKGSRPEIKLNIWDSGVIICWFEDFGGIGSMVLAARTQLRNSAFVFI